MLRMILVVVLLCVVFVPAWNNTIAWYYPVNWDLYNFVTQARKKIPKQRVVYTIAMGPEILYYSHRYGWNRYPRSNEEVNGKKMVEEIERLKHKEGLQYVLCVDYGRPFNEIVLNYLKNQKVLYSYDTHTPGKAKYYLLKLVT